MRTVMSRKVGRIIESWKLISGSASPISIMRCQGPTRLITAYKNQLQIEFSSQHNYKVYTEEAKNLISSAFETYPELNEINQKELLNYLEFMATFPFSFQKSIEMLLKYPTILEKYETKVGKCIDGLRDAGFSTKQRFNLLHRSPQLIEIPTKALKKRTAFLRTYFTNDESVQLVLKSHEVLIEDEHSLKKKLEYLIKDASHETKDLVSCKCLAYSLKHIKLRHVFLLRAGLFKPLAYTKLIKVLNKEGSLMSSRPDYFSPLEIVCYNDEDYLKACTKNQLDLNELAAFEQVYDEEFLREDSDDELFLLLNDENEDKDYNKHPENSANSVTFSNPSERQEFYF